MLSETVKGFHKTAILGFLLCILPSLVAACSTTACLNRGVAMRRDFTVLIKHDGEPLQRVRVQVTSSNGTENTLRFSGITDASGKVYVKDLAPGDYWLNAALLGIDAADLCFHVSEKAFGRAKRLLRFEWGDLAPATSRIAGELVNSEPGTGGSPVWNSIHRVSIPIVGAVLRLQNPVSGDAFDTVSGAGGSFTFDRVPNGTYVLHIEPGGGDHEFDPADLLVELSPSASKSKLMLLRTEATAGSCGSGISLQLR